MIFPSPAQNTNYSRLDDQAILNRMESSWTAGNTVNQVFWNEADIDHRFECGDQTVLNEYYPGMPINQRRQFSFNRIRRVISRVSGHQRLYRKSTVVIPVENGDQETSDQFTKILLWADRSDNISETISQAFEGSLICGLNLLQVWMDYREDPVNGNIKVANTGYNQFLIDPFFKKHDLSDCQWLWKREYKTKKEILSLLPDQKNIILGLQGRQSGTGRDAKFQFTPETLAWNVDALLVYDEYYYRDFRTQKLLVDMETGETTEWLGKDDEMLKLFLASEPNITVIETEIPTVNVAIVVEDIVLYNGAQSTGLDDYPFVAVLSYYRPQVPYFEWRLQGMVRQLRDPQYLYNRRKVIELDTMESQTNSGWIYREDALVNPADVYNQAGQGKGIALKSDDGRPIADLIQQIAPAPIAPTTLELSKIMSQEINDISGISDEQLGTASEDVAGFLAMMRNASSLVTLQNLFDNLDSAQKQLGRLMIKLIQTNFTPGKIKNILEGEEPAPLFYNKAFGKYHAAVEEGFNTTTQKQMEFAQRLQLRQVGVPITDEDLLESATLQGKNKIIENMQRQKQAMAQQQQMQMQAQMQEAQARTELAKSRAIADRGLGAERMSRIQENEALAVERRAAAEKDHDAAFLDLIKALKEIDGMDIDHIQRLIGLSHQIKSQEQMVENQGSLDQKMVKKQSSSSKPRSGGAMQSLQGIA